MRSCRVAQLGKPRQRLRSAAGWRLELDIVPLFGQTGRFRASGSLLEFLSN
jgi:hypothetical protein